jgi:3-oxoacyl-[acyl-carrier protein] reductase
MSKKYLIVGGSSGIGLALTKRLAAERNKVIVLSRNQNQLELNDNIEHHKIDVLDQSQNLPSFEEELDGLAYCPGSINLRPFKSLKEQDYIDDFRDKRTGCGKSYQSIFCQILKKLRNPPSSYSALLLCKQECLITHQLQWLKVQLKD